MADSNPTRIMIDILSSPKSIETVKNPIVFSFVADGNLEIEVMVEKNGEFEPIGTFHPPTLDKIARLPLHGTFFGILKKRRTRTVFLENPYIITPFLNYYLRYREEGGNWQQTETYTAAPRTGYNIHNINHKNSIINQPSKIRTILKTQPDFLAWINYTDIPQKVLLSVTSAGGNESILFKDAIIAKPMQVAVFPISYAVIGMEEYSVQVKNNRRKHLSPIHKRKVK